MDESSPYMKRSEVYSSCIDITLINQKNGLNLSNSLRIIWNPDRVGGTQRACSRGIIPRLRVECRLAETPAYSLMLIGRLTKPIEVDFKIPIVAFYVSNYRGPSKTIT